MNASEHAAEKLKIQINYKSGISMVIECDEFTVTRNKLNGARGFEWVGAVPDPMLLNANEVESVWAL